VLLSAGEQTLLTMDDLQGLLGERGPGAELDVDVGRGVNRLSLHLNLAEAPARMQ